MDDAKSRGEAPRTAEPVTVSEFRARLAEMIGRVEQGEEILIARGREPVAKLVGLRRKSRRRLGVLKELMGEEALNALTEAVEEPLSQADQAALEGALTDSLGITKPPRQA